MTDEPSKTPLAVLGELGAALSRSEQTVDRLENTLRDERANQKRFRWTLGAIMTLLLLMLAVLGVNMSVQRDAKDASETLQDCLIPRGDCYKRLAQQGLQGAVRNIRFQYCALTIPPERRTDAAMNSCVRQAFPDVPNIVELIREDQ